MTTTTTTTAVPEPFPFTGLPALPVQDRSRYPRAQIIFQNAAVAITAGGASDQRWVVDCPLPQGYAYTLAECHLRIHGLSGDLALWNKSAAGRFFSIAPFPIMSIPFDGISLDDTMVSSTLNMRHFTFPDMPKSIIINADNVNMTVGTLEVGDAAMTGVFFVMLHQYDIEQANQVLVNTPLLTR